jgi:elongator complex protein 1
MLQKPKCPFPAFIEAEKPSKAMVAHEKALQWQELFDLASRQETPQDVIVAMGYRVAGNAHR